MLKLRRAHRHIWQAITYISVKLVNVCDSPPRLFPDRWVTGDCLAPHIKQQQSPEFITICHLLYMLSAIKPPCDLAGYITRSANQWERLKPTSGQTSPEKKKRLPCRRSPLPVAARWNNYTHHALVPGLGEGPFVGNVTPHPAVGDHVAGDWWVVNSQRALPAHHQCRLVQRLDLHAHWGAAAHWETTK